MIFIRVLHIISGNDVGGGANHVLNICSYKRKNLEFILCCIGKGPLYSKAKDQNIKVISFTLKEMIKGRLEQYVNEKPIDILNFHGAKSNFIYLLINKKINIPSVATVHSDYRYDFLNSKFKKMFYTPLSAAGLKKFKNYICVSQHIKNILDESQFKGEKYVVNNGINVNEIVYDKDKAKFRRELNIKESDFLYIMVARMHPIKNHLTAIKAFNNLRIEHSDVKLLFIGNGELEEHLKEEVKKLEIQHSVIFGGFKYNALDYVNTADISLLTSFSEGGSPPLVVLESGIVNKPIICSKVSDMNEIINEENGFLIDPYSVEDVYLKMKDAYLNKDRLQYMGENLYKKVVNEFSINQFWEKYYDSYCKIIDGVN